MFIRKGLSQMKAGIKRPAQARRVLSSEAKFRLGVPTLRSVELAVTWICNLKCKFCYAEDLMHAQHRPPNIAVDDVRKLLQDTRDLGMIHVNITGGEPLVRKDIMDVVDAVPKDVVSSIVVNSTLLTKEKIDALKEAGLSTIQMSYGSYYLKHFKLDLAKYAISRGLGVTLSVVNIEPERQNVLDALEMAPKHGFTVLYNYPMRYNNTGLDNDIYWKHRNLPYVREDNMFWSGKDRCPAGTQKIYVTNDGDVMTCDRIHGCYGNIYKEPVKDIWMRMYEQFKDVKTYCLLETCPKQWEENNRRVGKAYPVDHIGTETNPFNVFEGTKFEEGQVAGSDFAQEIQTKKKATV